MAVKLWLVVSNDPEWSVASAVFAGIVATLMVMWGVKRGLDQSGAMTVWNRVG